MAKNFIQPGNVIEYTPTADVVSGQVVKVGSLLGVALNDIPAGIPGQVQITGVFSVPKVSAASFTAGEPVMWNAASSAFDNVAAQPATGDVTGPCAVAFADAAAGQTTMLVRFTGVPGTVH